VVGDRPDLALLAEGESGLDATLAAGQPDEIQEPVERAEQVSLERRIGAERGDILIGQQGSVRVELAGLAQREHPLDEIVVVLHLLIAEVPELGEGPSFAVEPSSLVEFEQTRHHHQPPFSESGIEGPRTRVQMRFGFSPW
jgi:hypothetical protein